jgi:acid phosphatase type 7
LPSSKAAKITPDQANETIEGVVMSKHKLAKGRGAGNRRTFPSAPSSAAHAASSFKSHAEGSKMPVQSKHFVDPHYPFQPLPPPLGKPPFRFDLTELLHQDEVDKIAKTSLVFHTVGDTGDERGKEMDFVAAMMTQDYDDSAEGEVPAFFYHLGDVVYFAGDISTYGETFYETYAEYPGLIVSIPGNHDCQPDDPQDGPVDPNKKPLDGWVQNFMSDDPTRLGSLKTTSSRTQMDLPNVYWTFTTPLATIIGLFSNVSETEAEIHPDQVTWFKGELTAADADKALIVAIHHPPFSGDTEHSGSTAAEKVLFESFAATGKYPHLVLSGHVHNYQRFTVQEKVKSKTVEVPCVVAGAGGYSKLGTLHKIKGKPAVTPLQLSDTLRLECYDDQYFGFLRLEVTKEQITGSYYSAPFQEGVTPKVRVTDGFTIDLAARTIR